MSENVIDENESILVKLCDLLDIPNDKYADDAIYNKVEELLQLERDLTEDTKNIEDLEEQNETLKNAIEDIEMILGRLP